MQQHWPWWLSGVSLAGVVLTNWALMRRLLNVSGRFTALVDRGRHGATQSVDMSDAELVEAVREATRAEFGEDALQETPMPIADAPPARRSQQATSDTAFLMSLLLGGALSALLAGDLHSAFALRSELFRASFGSSPVVTAFVLLGGGVLVGFGTRMAGGCTSGHGLCGVSRAQTGSLLATAAFFGMGTAVSLLLDWFR